MYRTLVICTNKLPQDVVSMLLGHSISLTETLQQNLDDIKSSAAPPFAIISGFKLKRGHLIEMIKVLQAGVPFLNDSESHKTLLSIFWLAISFLRSTEPSFFPMVELSLSLDISLLNLCSQTSSNNRQQRYEALILISVLTAVRFFDRVDQAKAREHIATITSLGDWEFKGIVPLVVQALYNPRTEEIAYNMLANTLFLAENPLIYPIQYLFTVVFVSTIPWLHHCNSPLNSSARSRAAVCLYLYLHPHLQFVL